MTTGHIAGVPVRNRAAVTFGRYYGISVLTCEPADPASKGGVENAVKLAKADIVPTETNPLAQYATFTDVETACSQFVTEINARVHRTTGRRPVEMLTQERPALHAVPDLPHTAALGMTRRVPDNTPMASVRRSRWPGSPSNRSEYSCVRTAPTIPWARPWPRSCALSSSSSMTLGYFRSGRMPPRVSTASSKPPTNAGLWGSRRTCVPADSTN